MNTTQAIKQTAELAETIGAGFVVATNIFPSGSYSTSADDRQGAIDGDHAMYWSLRLRMSDEW